MWLVSSCCWAKALSDIKSATNPTEILLLISACRAPENRCAVTQEPHWSRLNSSVVGLSSTRNPHPHKPTHFCPLSHLSAGLWICKRCALGREHLVHLQRDGLVQDGSEIPHQDRLRETLQRDAAAALQWEQLRPAWGERGPAADQTKQFQSGQGGCWPEGSSTGQLQTAAIKPEPTADVPRQAWQFEQGEVGGSSGADDICQWDVILGSWRWNIKKTVSR